MDDESRNYSVYEHVFPDGSMYVGISNDPQARWANGRGYQTNEKMFSAIIKYGWDNIEHKIVADRLTVLEAEEMERSLIAELSEIGKKLYNTVWNPNNQKQTYNYEHYWLDEEVTEESSDKYWARFEMLDDDWIAICTGSGVVSGSRICGNGMSYHIIRQERRGTVKYIEYFADFPRSNMTFREVHEWLFTGPAFYIKEMRSIKLPEAD